MVGFKPLYVVFSFFQAKKRTNVIPIIEDARHPHKYRMLVPMVDCVFADVAQPDQTRIVALNSHSFLKNGGHFVISIKVLTPFHFQKRLTFFLGQLHRLNCISRGRVCV